MVPKSNPLHTLITYIDLYNLQKLSSLFFILKTTNGFTISCENFLPRGGVIKQCLFPLHKGQMRNQSSLLKFTLGN